MRARTVMAWPSRSSGPRHRLCRMPMNVCPRFDRCPSMIPTPTQVLMPVPMTSMRRVSHRVARVDRADGGEAMGHGFARCRLPAATPSREGASQHLPTAPPTPGMAARARMRPGQAKSWPRRPKTGPGMTGRALAISRARTRRKCTRKPIPRGPLPAQIRRWASPRVGRHARARGRSRPPRQLPNPLDPRWRCPKPMLPSLPRKIAVTYRRIRTRMTSHLLRARGARGGPR